MEITCNALDDDDTLQNECTLQLPCDFVVSGCQHFVRWVQLHVVHIGSMNVFQCDHR